MKRISPYSGLLLLLLLSLVGLLTYDEYGISFDEKTQRTTGEISYKYVFSDNEELLEWKDRDYGVAFELPLIIAEKLLGLEDSRSIYLSRHLITHFFFLISAFFCFLLIDYLYKNKLLATIGFLFFVLHPRIYAHSFFNTKDIPFMAMFLICFYLCARAFNKKTLLSYILLGIGVGLLINLRIMGVLLLCCVLFFLTIDFFREKKYRKTSSLAFVFLITTLAVLLATWPFLWKNPISNFLFAFKNMSKFRWNGLLLFKGDLTRSYELGWDYIPVWFTITTPVLYLMAGAFGAIVFCIKFLKNPLSYLTNSKERNNLLYMICFFSPILVVIVLHSVLYDGWRQLYFIYPSFVLIAVYGLNVLLTKNMKILAITLPLLCFAWIAFSMIENYPFQHVYFNRFMDTKTPEYLRKQFELDYWGTSYRQALEYILENDSSPSINIKMADALGGNNISILPAKERKRIHYVDDVPAADYYITNYRIHPQDYILMKDFKWHSIKVNNNSICAIFKQP